MEERGKWWTVTLSTTPRSSHGVGDHHHHHSHNPIHPPLLPPRPPQAQQPPPPQFIDLLYSVRARTYADSAIACNAVTNCLCISALKAALHMQRKLCPNAHARTHARTHTHTHTPQPPQGLPCSDGSSDTASVATISPFDQQLSLATFALSCPPPHPSKAKGGEVS
jgi:hypothetical protein